jgi:hypothetical protein
MIIQKAYEMPDRSLVIFGFPNGARANVTRVYNRWGATNYVLDQTHRGSYEAAVGEMRQTNSSGLDKSTRIIPLSNGLR